jgi:hypothetical protein
LVLRLDGRPERQCAAAVSVRVPHEVAMTKDYVPILRPRPSDAGASLRNMILAAIAASRRSA